MRKKETIPRFMWNAFTGYCVVMIWLLFLQRLGQFHVRIHPEELRENCKLIPFRTIAVYFKLAVGRAAEGQQTAKAVINLVGNVVLFIPLGFFLPYIWPKLQKFGRYLCWQAGIIVVVEVIQLFTGLGVCDVDDLLLNTAGAAVGFLCHDLLLREAKCRMSAGRKENGAQKEAEGTDGIKTSEIDRVL